MIATLLRLELLVPGSRSLKEKRGPLKSLQARLQQRFGCAVAEVDHQDDRMRATLGVALVSGSGAHLAERVQAVRTFAGGDPRMTLVSVSETTVDGPEPWDGFADAGAG